MVDSIESLKSIELGDSSWRVSAKGHFKDEDAKGYSPNPESSQLQIQVPQFEGPLDLLLHLINKHSLDIFDIPISIITEKYLEEIKKLELDLAGEFLLMAATLTQIKSKMLLPKEEQDEESSGDETGLDPRADLVRRLLEYQRFKEVAACLAEKDTLGFSVFGRKYDDLGFDFGTDEDNLELSPIQAFELIESYASMIESSSNKIAHTVSFDVINLRARLTEMIDFSRMKVTYLFKEALSFFGARTKLDLIVTFLAVLEMARLKIVEVEQEPGLSEIKLKNISDEFDGDLGDVEL